MLSRIAPGYFPGNYMSYNNRLVMTAFGGTATYHSDNGGKTWQAGGTAPKNGGFGGCYDPQFGTLSSYSWAGNGFCYSANGGVSWTGGTASSFSPSCGIYDPKNKRIIMLSIAGSSKATQYSADGGKTYSAGAVVADDNWWFGVYNPSTQSVIALSNGTTASRISTDGAATWSTGGTTPQVGWDGMCYDPIHNRVIATAISSTYSCYTANGGTTWSAGGALPSTATWATCCYDPLRKRVFAVNRSGGTAYSTDGAANWSAGGTSISADALIYHPPTGNLVVIGGGTPYVQYSADGGANWSSASGFSAVRYSTIYVLGDISNNGIGT